MLKLTLEMMMQELALGGKIEVHTDKPQVIKQMVDMASEATTKLKMQGIEVYFSGKPTVSGNVHMITLTSNAPKKYEMVMNKPKVIKAENYEGFFDEEETRFNAITRKAAQLSQWVASITMPFSKRKSTYGGNYVSVVRGEKDIISIVISDHNDTMERYFKWNYTDIRKANRLSRTPNQKYEYSENEDRTFYVTGKSSYALHDVEMISLTTKDYTIPSQYARETVPVGTQVKLIFDAAMPERMWVTVTELTGEGYIGILDNDPYDIDDLKYQDRIEFQPQHIMSILSK